jgi:hypothetical protein
MSSSLPPDQRPSPSSQNIANTISEVSERATLLVREEVELAKAEVTLKLMSLMRGAVVGVAAGIFILTAILFFLVGCAWLLYYYLPGATFAYFWGFFGMAVILVLLGAFAGFIASRVLKASAPPVPEMAIEEARRIRDTVSPAEGTQTAIPTAANGAADGGPQAGAGMPG